MITLPLRSRLRFPTTLLALIPLLATGCRPADPPPRAEVSSVPQVDAETRLHNVFRRYQVTSYYHDDGEVVLQAPGAKSFRSSETETAPLKVHFTPHDLRVEAYTARIRVLASPDTSDHDREQIEMHAWFDEPESSHFDAQVLRQTWRSAMADRLPLQRVLADEVLRARLSAGLAGPPPQLEWLLADDPMQKLFTPETKFEWIDSASLDGASLQRIAATSRSERFVFWIDPTTSLIRRVELPLPDLAGNGAGIDRSDWSLRLELLSATFEPPRSGQASTFPYPPRDPKWVGAFVPLPPPPPSGLIGRQVSLASLADPVTSPGERRFLLIAIPPDDASDRSAWLRSWMPAVPALASAQSGKTQVIVVSADREVSDALRGLPASAVTIVDPRGASKLTRQLRLDAGAMALVQPAADGQTGKVLLTETAINSSTLSNTFAVIRDAMAGINVPDRIHRDYDAIVADYQDRLEKQRAQ
ncbi:hypothetical protein [Allorhodopirellula solitaria]|uniref:Uncharacterized protein n=1 Tax=Allorhodopirellula solitaria TaxID=2527987 RepID=A0A5C5XQ76_9BACT|nr:hypothetical protein [Allorhodopirellula solitaria]TWT64631.1 hypothetical protein CA85_37640 [Allorhodopirellula solitaria]